MQSIPAIKPIPTFYNGRTYRSKLEATWAVFLDDLEIDFRYETQGYELANGERYLPDFFLTRVELFAEVKPKLKMADVRRINRFVAAGLPYDIVLLVDEPRCAAYRIVRRKLLGDKWEAIHYNLSLDPFWRPDWYIKECRFYEAFNRTEFSSPSMFSSRYVEAVRFACDAKFDRGQTPIPRTHLSRFERFKHDTQWDFMDFDFGAHGEVTE